MANRQVKVTLSAQVQEYISGMEKAAQATRDTGSEAEKLAQKRESFTLMGQAAMAGGAAVLAGLAMASKAATDWDSAWAGVLKTVDGSPEQLERVEAGLRDLTSVLPASHTEIAAVAEAAGQLGIQTDNVVAFTRTMIDLGETTNLSAEDAATSLARFTNIMGTSQSEVSNLGAALVDLGNNYATTEREILEMSMRLAGAGKQIGMTEGDVLGLSTALSSVGIEAEAGGSAMSKVMIDIAASVEEGGERIDEFAKIAGVSAKEFSDLWGRDAGGALALFVQGLADAESQGTSTLGMIEDLGIKEVRMRDALLRSASAADQFSAAMQKGNDAFQENTALTHEAEMRYETTAAKLDIMKNQVVDTAISLGEHLLPAIEFGAESVGQFTSVLDGLDGPLGAIVTWGGLIIGTGLLSAGLWMTALPKIAEYRKALIDLELAGGKLHRTLGFVGKAAALGAAVGVMIALIREAEAETTKLNAALQRAAEGTEAVAHAAEAFENRSWGHLYGEFNKIEMSAENIGDALAYADEQASKGWWQVTNLPGEEALRSTLRVLEVLGDEMATIASTDVVSFQSAMSSLADDYAWTSEEQLAFINNSEDLREALEVQAVALGGTADDAGVLKVAMGELKHPVNDAAEATSMLAEAAQTAEDDLRELQRALEDIAAEAINMGDMQDRAQSAINRLVEAAEAEAVSLDGSNNASIALRDSMREVELSHRDAAEAMIQNGESAESAMAHWERGREAIIRQREAMGDSREEAIAWADENLGSAAEVKVALEQVAQAVNNIPKNPHIAVTVDARQALRELDAVIAKTGSIPSNWRPSHYSTQPIPMNEAGGLYEEGVQYFADGGITPGMYRGGQTLYGFAEPGVPWEAFISGKESERDRNRQIWQETGQRLGMDTVGKSVVHVPTHVTVQDADGRLIGTMAVVANEAIDDFVTESSSVVRRA